MNVNRLIGRNVELNDGNMATIIDAFKDFRNRDVIVVKFDDGSESNIYSSEIKILKMESNMNIDKSVKYVNYKGKYYKVNHALGKDVYGHIEIISLKDPSLGIMVDPSQVRPASQNQVDAIERIYGGSDQTEESMNEIENDNASNMSLKDVLSKAKGLNKTESDEMYEELAMNEAVVVTGVMGADDRRFTKRFKTQSGAEKWIKNNEDNISDVSIEIVESKKRKFKEAIKPLKEATIPSFVAFDFCNNVLKVNDKVMDVSNNKIGFISEIVAIDKIKVKMDDKIETHVSNTVMKI